MTTETVLTEQQKSDLVWYYGMGFTDIHVIELAVLQSLRDRNENQHQDDIAVDEFAAAMKSKLAKKRAEGRGGWQDMSATELSELLHEHVSKGDPLDVANLAMMLHQNGQPILQSPEIQALRKDAERLKEYLQMVRDKNPSTPTFDGQHWIVPRHGGGYRTVSGDIVCDHYVYFVDAIDAAMEQQA